MQCVAVLAPRCGSCTAIESCSPDFVRSLPLRLGENCPTQAGHGSTQLVHPCTRTAADLLLFARVAVGRVGRPISQASHSGRLDDR
eukprot:6806469-Alexandrium_andersonii.AAC.1